VFSGPARSLHQASRFTSKILQARVKYRLNWAKCQACNNVFGQISLFFTVPPPSA